MNVTNTTAPTAQLLGDYPILDADQRRRLAKRLRETIDLPADAAHAAALITVGTDLTADEAYTAQYAHLNTPNLNAATSDGPAGLETRTVGWWQGVGLPMFKIGEWTPNGRESFTVAEDGYLHPVTGQWMEHDWTRSNAEYITVDGERLLDEDEVDFREEGEVSEVFARGDGTAAISLPVQEKRREVLWPVATVADDGALEVTINTAVRVVLDEESQIRRPVDAEITTFSPRELDRDLPSGGLFSGGLGRVRAVYVRYLADDGSSLGGQWVAVTGLPDMMAAYRNAVRRLDETPYGLAAVELHKTLQHSGQPLVAPIAIVPAVADLTTLGEVLTEGQKKTRPRRSVQADIEAMFDELCPHEDAQADKVRFGRVVRTQDLAARLAALWQVKYPTALTRVRKALTATDSTPHSLIELKDHRLTQWTWPSASGPVEHLHPEYLTRTESTKSLTFMVDGGDHQSGDEDAVPALRVVTVNVAPSALRDVSPWRGGASVLARRADLDQWWTNLVEAHEESERSALAAEREDLREQRRSERRALWGEVSSEDRAMIRTLVGFTSGGSGLDGGLCGRVNVQVDQLGGEKDEIAPTVSLQMDASTARRLATLLAQAGVEPVEKTTSKNLTLNGGL